MKTNFKSKRSQIFLFLILLFSGFSIFSQSFTLPSDDKWYLVATMGGRHAYIEYIYDHTTAHNPSITKGEIQFINAKTYIIQKHQSMGYSSWNQPQFAVINKGNISELWVKATTGINSGAFEITQSKYASLRLGDTNDLNLADNGGNLKIYDKLRDNSHFYSGNLNVMDGNVGIGTTNPDMKLTVKGNIHAEEVKIDLNVPAPDYVFKKDYNLRSIEEVENFIKENSHLPEIPSAKEFEQNGIMQAEMDMNLLKKIEELTLYTIQQEKKINKLEKENESLKMINLKLLDLQKRLKELEKK